MNLVIFSGTGDGRTLCERLAVRGVPAAVCVATPYGESAMPALPGIRVHTGRMDCQEMLAFLKSYDTAVDATHPYAATATENIREACRALGVRYLRLLRPGTELPGNAVSARCAREAAEYLNTVPGKALLTTGSRDLEAFTAVRNFSERLYPRVLPAADVLEKCLRLGFRGQNLICMQGPFSHEMNVAMLRHTGVGFLVTKDSGEPGGIAQKLSAAGELGVTPLVIARPSGEDGYTVPQLEELLAGKTPRKAPPGNFGRFPLFIDLADKLCVVIGGGEVACRRTEILLSFGARVVVVAPEILREFENGVYLRRAYRHGDCRGAAVAVAATDDPRVNQAVAEECGAAGIPVSVADNASVCTFFFPAICRRGKLTAGVVSDGSDHRLTAEAARKIRKAWEDCFE